MDLEAVPFCYVLASSFKYTPTAPAVNAIVVFDASASTPGYGNLIEPDSYVWNFGDNTTDTGKIVAHVYTKLGDYTVALNVTNSERRSNIHSELVTVTAAAEVPWWVSGNVVILIIMVVVGVAVFFANGLVELKKRIAQLEKKES